MQHSWQQIQAEHQQKATQREGASDKLTTRRTRRAWGRGPGAKNQGRSNNQKPGRVEMCEVCVSRED